MNKSTDKSVHDKIIKEVKRIEFAVRKLMSGASLGVKNSVIRGQGMTFSDIRSYTPGDDIRNFAWQVMARTGEPFVKEFEEERDLEVHVALDVGQTMQFGGLDKSKALIQAYILTFLGFSASKSKDKFGGVLFSSGQDIRIPVKRGDNHVRRVLYSYLEKMAASKSKTSDLNAALDYFSKLKSKNCICVLVSDFSKPFDRKLLARVKAKHEVKIIFINDDYEKAFPNFGLTKVFSASHSNRFFWIKGERSENQKLEENFLRRKKKVQLLCKSFGISFIDQNTKDDELREMTKTLKLRSAYG